MCEYCKEDKRSKRKFIMNSPILSIRIIHANELNAFEILSVNRANEIVKSYQIINYCPMCGRKLREEDKR